MGKYKLIKKKEKSYNHRERKNKGKKSKNHWKEWKVVDKKMYLKKTKTEESKKEIILESQTANGRTKNNLWQLEIETELIKKNK